MRHRGRRSHDFGVDAAPENLDHPPSGLAAEMAGEFARHGHVRLPDAVDLSAGSRLRALFGWSLREAGLGRGTGRDCPPGLTSLPPTKVADMAVVAPRLWEVVCEILGGAARVKRPALISNALICNYRTTVLREDWHVDGDFFVHHADSPEQALLIFILWTDVRAGDGATQIAPGATAGILRHLAAHPAGSASGQISTNRFVKATRERMSLVGDAGDAWLLHPLTAHRSVPNPYGEPRFISNPVVALREPLRLGGAAPSPLERLTTHLLGGTEFRPPRDSARRAFRPDRIARWSEQGRYTAEDSRLPG